MLGLASIAIVENRKAHDDQLIGAYRTDQPQPQGRQIGGLTLDLAAAMVTASPADTRPAALARLRQVLSIADAAVIRDDLIGAAAACGPRSLLR